MWDIKTELKGSVAFSHYREGNLYYKTDGGFVFKVPTSDFGTGTALPSDKALFYMRWLKPQLSEANKELGSQR